MADFDLAIIGTGSGNSLVTPDFDDKRVAIVEAGTFGGTCLNVGCIPTKMYVYAADVAATVRHAARFGIDARLDGRPVARHPRPGVRPDRPDLGGRPGVPHRRAEHHPFRGHAEFTGPKSLRISTGEQAGAEFSAEQIVIAAGGRPMIPDVVAQSGVPYHTSDTIMRLDELPERLVILGGGYIGAEFAHVFSALGSQVSVVARSTRLLRHLDSEISDRFTQLAATRWDLHLGVEVGKLTGDRRGVRLDFTDGSCAEADLLLVATGRVPNTDRLGLAAAGIQTLSDGRVKVDCYGRTNVDGGVGARRRLLGLPAQARGQPRGQGGRAQPGPSRRTCASSTTATFRRRSSPTRRSPASA